MNNANLRREIYKRLAIVDPPTLYRIATRNKAAKNIQAHLNVLKRALYRRFTRRKKHSQARQRFLESPGYRISLWNSRNEAAARQRMRGLYIY